MSEMKQRELPSGWKWTSIGECCRVVNGTTPKTSVSDNWGGTISWITPTDLGKLKDAEIRASGRTITEAGLKSAGLEIVPPGTVVLSSRAPIGHLGIAKIPICTNQGCKSLIPSNRVDTGFLYLALRNAVGRLRDLGSGATFAEVSKTQVENFEIPLPPLAEQQRIAQLLKTKLAAVERARQASEARLAAARKLSAAYLREVFESEDAVEWPTARLIDICHAKGQYGTSQKSNNSGNGLPILGMKHIQDGRLVYDDMSYVDLDLREREKYILNRGDIVFNRTNSAELVGKSGVFDSKDEIVFASYLIRFVIDNDKSDPRFVNAYINSPRGRVFIENRMTRAIGQVNISASTMHEMIIPTPPASFQRDMMDEYEARMHGLSALMTGLMEECAAIKSLPASLLRQAFSGAL